MSSLPPALTGETSRGWGMADSPAPLRTEPLASPRAWWLISKPLPIALPAYLARAWRRAGLPVMFGTHAEASDAGCDAKEIGVVVEARPAEGDAGSLHPVEPCAAGSGGAEAACDGSPDVRFGTGSIPESAEVLSGQALSD
jgi:hypothetical protein